MEYEKQLRDNVHPSQFQKRVQRPHPPIKDEVLIPNIPETTIIFSLLHFYDRFVFLSIGPNVKIHLKYAQSNPKRKFIHRL